MDPRRLQALDLPLARDGRTNKALVRVRGQLFGSLPLCPGRGQMLRVLLA